MAHASLDSRYRCNNKRTCTCTSTFHSSFSFPTIRKKSSTSFNEYNSCHVTEHVLHHQHLHVQCTTYNTLIQICSPNISKGINLTSIKKAIIVWYKYIQTIWFVPIQGTGKWIHVPFGLLYLYSSLMLTPHCTTNSYLRPLSSKQCLSGTHRSPMMPLFLR